MATLVHQCLRHPARPASARCPSCRQSYCRECIVEHEFRLICADCLRRLQESAARPAKRRRLAVAPIFQLAAAVAVVWFVFHTAAALLQRIPSEVHEGIIWNDEE